MLNIIKSFRLISLTATATPWLAVLLISLLNQYKINWFTSLLSLVGILILQLGVNVMNDVSDYKRNIDIEGEFGGSGVLVDKSITPRFLQLMGSVFFCISAAIATYLVKSNDALLYVILIGGISAILYSLPFFGLKYIALGDITVFICCGPILTLGYALCMSTVSFEHAIVGAFFGFYAVGILHTNNMEDITIDKKVNVYTLANIVGFDKSKYLLLGFYLLGSISLFNLFLFNKLTIYPFVFHFFAYPMGIKILALFFRANSPNDKSIKLLRIKASQFHLLSGLLVCAGLGLEFWL